MSTGSTIGTADTADLPLMGRLIDGRYQLRRSLGEGGFAQVWEALDAKLERSVAVKLLKHLDDPDRRFAAEKRFFREAKLAAKLNHPDVVTIYDFGISHGSPYIVLELLEGQTLAQELWLNGPMAPEDARRLFERVLHAMATAHKAGVIHRDLKPGNLVLTHRKELVESLRILDFGIAFYFGENITRLTRAGQFLGTPEYIAPEYVTEQKVTPALDVYQLGLIFIEMLIGRPLVSLEHPLQCMFAHCTGRVAVPDYLADSPVGEVLSRAIATELHERYQNARAFLEAFEKLEPGDIPALPADELPEKHAITNPWESEEVQTWSRSIPNLFADDFDDAFSEPAEAVAQGEARNTTEVVSRMPRTGARLPLLLVALLTVMVVAVWVARSPDETQATASPPEEPGTVALVATSEPEEVVRTPPPPEVEAEEPVSEDAGSHGPRLIRIVTTPPGAELTDDGVLLGFSPMEIAVASGERRKITARLEGYVARSVLLGDTTQSSLNLKLQRRRPQPARATPREPEPEPAPPLREFD